MQDTNVDCARKCEAVRTVSVAIVAHNEAQHFSNILEDVVAQDFPHNRIELLLIDSMSKDDTKQVMLEFAESDQAKGFQRVAVLSNPGEILPCGCNVAIKNFTGDALVRIDAHARIPQSFISSNVEVLDEGEFVCGGPRPTIASPETDWSNTLLMAEESAFGSSIADYRGSSKKEYVSSAFHAMFRREAIERVGLYDERLARTEDNDYFYRVREAGYKIRFDVRIQSKQIARSSLKRMLKQKYGNGYWIGRTMYVQPKCFRAYHFAPFAFVLGIILLACVGFLRGWAPFVACAALYAAVTVVLTLRVAVESPKRNIRMVALPLVFFGIHVSYGVGTLVGLLSGTFKKMPSFDTAFSAEEGE